MIPIHAPISETFQTVQLVAAPLNSMTDLLSALWRGFALRSFEGIVWCMGF
jgi:hypothetical protein